jgi:hypothetical protein
MYGCIDESTGKVRKTVAMAEKRPIDNVYYSGELGSDCAAPDQTQGEFRPDCFINFKPPGGAEGLVAARQELYCSIDES